MFKFLHAADIHLDSPLRGLDRYEGAPVEEIRHATRRALENLVSLAIGEAVAFVVIAGDVYDGDWQDFNTGLFFTKQMSRLREAGIAVVLISGNHDAANKMTKTLELPPNVRTLPTKSPATARGEDLGFGLEHLDVAFHGQGFQTAAVDENVVLKYPPAQSGRFNIGLLHTSLDMDSGGEHARYAPCSVGDLRARNYDYWALGHVHRRRTIDGDAPIVYPGNIQGRHIREAEPKGCQLVTVDDRGRATLEFQPLDVFRWHEARVPVDGAADGEAVLECVHAALRDVAVRHQELPTAVRVVLTGVCPAHRQLAGAAARWTHQIRAVAVDVGQGSLWVEKVKFQTQADAAATTAADDGPLREVAAYLQELRERGELLDGLRNALAPFQQKLPDELCAEDGGAEPLRLDDAEFLRRMLDEVEPLLLSRLASQEGVA